MNALSLWNPGDPVIVWGLNVLLQVSFVAVVALAIAAFQRRSSAVRYWVLCSSLMLVLFSPLIVVLLQASGKSLWAVSLTQTPVASNGKVDDSADAPATADLLRDSAEETADPFTVDNLDRRDRPGAAPPAGARNAITSPTPALTPSQDDAITATVTLPSPATWVGRMLRAVMPPLLFVWFMGAAFLLFRLALGWCRLAAILRSAKPHANILFEESFKQAGRAFGLARMPELVLSQRISTPVAAGLLRPRVVLPERMIDRVAPEQLRDVFVHEVAHIVRRDQVVVLLQNIAAAVFWLHPLVRVLNRRLAQAREEVCDNYVLAATDAPSYSRTLLTLAELVQSSAPLPGAVGLFTSRWKLERRVADLLDERRCRMIRPTMRGKALVIALSLVMTTIAALGTLTLAVGQTGDADAAAAVAPPGPHDEADANAGLEPEPQTHLTVRGTAVDAEGKPAAGAFVAVVALNLHPKPGATTSDLRGEVLGEATTDEDGEFELAVTDAKSERYANANLVARSSDSGIVWQKLDLDASETEATLTLPPQQLIQAQLVDLEGQPAVGLSLKVSAIVVAGEDIRASEQLGFYGLEQPPQAWPESVMTDDSGRITLRNIPPGHGVFINITGTEKFAPQDLALNTGMPEERGERDGTYRSLVKNIPPGEVATIPLAPAQFFEGVVWLGDSGKPAANARILMWASQQEVGGSMISTGGRTDDAGRFRLNPRPGVRYGIVAYPPEGTPYQVRRLDDLRWSSGAASKNIEIRLDEGVLARGTVVDAESGKPLHNASVQYHPDRVHNTNLTSNVVTGWQSIQKTDEAGRFMIPVLPGPGTLLVHAAEENYILREVGSRELSEGKPGGVRTYAHAFQKIDPQAGEPMEPMEIELLPGASVAGTLTDPDGNRIERALVVSRLKISASSPQWRGFSDEALNGRFKIDGLRDGEEYPIYFLDPKNRLGSTAMISAKNRSPTVVLEPCGSATGRFVGPDGKPVVGAGLGLHMVVTPGKPRYDFEAVRRGETVADEDFLANIDRDNHWSRPATDENGKVTFPALIPGATYRFINIINGKSHIAKEFVAKSAETYDMGEIDVQVND